MTTTLEVQHDTHTAFGRFGRPLAATDRVGRIDPSTYRVDPDAVAAAILDRLDADSASSASSASLRSSPLALGSSPLEAGASSR